MEPLIRKKLADYYQAVAAGNHSPAARYRLEGYLQACIDQQGVSREQVDELIAAAYREAYDSDPPVEPLSGDLLQLPHHTPVAPVYKPGQEPR